MSLTFPGTVACQKNCNKSSTLPPQNKYISKVHTPPYKRGARAKGKPLSDNQQAPQVSQYKKNGKNTPYSDSSDLSITAAILWLLFIKNLVFFSQNK